MAPGRARSTTMNTVTEDQHFVPKFYIRRFADTDQFLGVLDAKAKILLPRRPYASVCYAPFYYAVKSGKPDEASQLVEKWLKSVEDYVARQLPQIINNILTLKKIAESDKYVLAVLCSLLWLRGPYMRGQINRVQEEMMKHTMQFSAEHSVDQYSKALGKNWTESQKNDLIRFIKEGKYRIEFGNELHLKFLMDSLGLGEKGFTNLFFHKKWKIYIARGSKRFITSDSPVVEWSPPVRGFYGHSFLERTHCLALTPEIFIELTFPKGSEKAKRVTLFDEQEDIVKMYNILVAAHCHQFVYATDERLLHDLLSGLSSPGDAEVRYFDRFERPHHENDGHSI